MVVGRSGEKFPYFVWPDINYFPASGNRDEDVFWRRFQIGMSWIATPLVSMLGIAGNVLNIAILIRGRLTKSSTWLIFSLAVSDTIYLLGTNNIPIHLYMGEKGQFGFDSRKLPAQTLYYAYIVQITVELASKIVTLTLPSLITFDRLVAVFLPFRYLRVMTVKTVMCVVGLLYFLSMSYAIFSSFKFALSFTSLSKINMTTATNQQEDESSAINDSYIGLMAPSTFYVENYALHEGVRRALVYTYSLIPLFFTCVGCLAVGMRIRSQQSKRRTSNACGVKKTQMMKPCDKVCRCIKKISSPLGKTTRVLLSVCGMYCIANTINFTVLLFFNATNVSTGTAICLEMLRKFVLVLNSACNFLFYVGLNRNFKESYRKLFGFCFTQALVKD